VSSERHAVVGTDSLRQAELAEEPRKYGFGVGDGGIEKAVAAEDVAAEVIGDGKREAVAAVRF
jgi:hypothetical protein